MDVQLIKTDSDTISLIKKPNNLQQSLQKTKIQIYKAYSITRFTFSYVLSDYKKKPSTFKIGVATIFLVLCFMNILQDIIDLSPLVYLRINEQMVGESDQIIFPDLNLATPKENTSTIDYLFINHTQIDDSFCNIYKDIIFGCSPRWIFTGVLFNDDTNYNNIQTDSQLNDSLYYQTSYIIMLDSEKEISIGLGKHIQDLKPLKKNEAYIISSAYRQLGYPKNIRVQIDLIQYLKDLKQIDFDKYDNEDEGLRIEIKQIIKYYLEQSDIYSQLQNYLVNNNNSSNTTNNNSSQNNSSNSNFIRNDTINFSKIYDDIEKKYGFLPISQDQKNQFINLNITEDDILDGIAEFLIKNKLNVTVQPTQQLQDPAGKWPETFGNTIAFDVKGLPYMIQQEIPKILQLLMQQYNSEYNTNSSGMSFTNQAKYYALQIFIIQQINNYQKQSTIQINEYAFQTHIVYNNRAYIYRYSGYVYSYDLWVSNHFYMQLGKNYSAKVQSPLCYQTIKTLYTSSFLGNFFDTSIVLLLIISSFLIYLVSLSDCEEKTSEYSNLRVLGMNKINIFFILFVKSCAYSMASLGLSLIFSQIVRGLGAMYIFLLIQDVDNSSIINAAILRTSFILGVVLPLVSNIIPIRKAMLKSLRESLSKDRASLSRYFNEIKVVVLKLEKYGIDLSTVLISLLMIFMGYLCYYVMPKVFMNEDIVQFLFLINSCFLLMIFGLTIIVGLVRPFLQNQLLNILLNCFMRTDRNLKKIIQNNSRSNKRKTEKIAFIFSLIFTFFVFVVGGFTLQIKIVQDSIKGNVGADWTAELEANGKMDDYSIDTYTLDKFMNKYMQENPEDIHSYSYHSSDITIMPVIYEQPHNPKLRGPGQKPFIRISLKTVPNSYFDTVNTDFYVPGSILDNSHDYPLLPDGKTKNIMYSIYNEQGGARGFENSTNLQQQQQSVDQKLDNLDNEYILSSTYNRSFLDNRTDHVIYAIMYEGSVQELGVQNADSLLVLEINKTLFRFKPAHSVWRFPGIIKPMDQELLNRNYIIISQQSYNFIVQTMWNSPEANQNLIKNFKKKLPPNLQDNIPQSKIFVKFKRHLSKLEREDFTDQLKSSIRLQTPLVIFDVQDLMEQTDQAIDILHGFILIVGTLTILIGFLMLLVMFRNIIKEHLEEIKILRAVGINKIQLTKIYIYEAIILILSSSILGSIVGYIISFTLCKEVCMFLSININCLQFPYLFVSVLFILGMLAAVTSSYVAVKNIRDYSIEDITRKEI